MSILELSPSRFKLKRSGDKVLIFDPLRRKYITLTPEERVRQYFVALLIDTKGYPMGRIGNEISLKMNQRTFRCDTIVYDSYGAPLVIVEYKSATTPITQQVFDQIVRYNIALKVKYLFVTNGISFYGCLLNYETMAFTYLSEIPIYAAINQE